MPKIVKKAWNWLRYLISQVFAAAAGLSVIAAGVMLFLQILGWARTGEWTPNPAKLWFYRNGIDLGLVYHPIEWIGLASIAQWFLDLLLALWTVVLGLGVFGYLSYIIRPVEEVEEDPEELGED